MKNTKVIINAKLSSCCSTSVSGITPSTRYRFSVEEIKGFHYVCNSCKKECTMIEVPYWELTEKGKYRRLNVLTA